MVGSGWIRLLAGTVVAGAGLWLVAGVLVIWEPGGVSVAGTYSMLVPIALVLLVVGFGGLNAWLAGPVPVSGRRRWREGLASGLMAMSSRRHQSLSATEGNYQESGLSARRVGVLAMRAGAIAIVVASLLLQGGSGGPRSLLFFGWFLFFGGAGVFGIVVIIADEAPRWAGALLAAGSLLVLSPIATTLGGASRRPEMLGPLLPSVDGGLVPSFILWLIFGAGCAWLGVALWNASLRSPVK